MDVIIAFDLSTTISGYAVFDVKTKKLIECGGIHPNKQHSSNRYPYSSLNNMRSIATDVQSIIKTWEAKSTIDYIVIEEIIKGGASGIMSLKVLAGLFFIVLDRFKTQYKIQTFTPSAWRKIIGIKLSENDKLINKIAKSDKTVSKITYKDVALRDGIKLFPYYDFKIEDHDAIEAALIGYASLI